LFHIHFILVVSLKQNVTRRHNTTKERLSDTCTCTPVLFTNNNGHNIITEVSGFQTHIQAYFPGCPKPDLLYPCLLCRSVLLCVCVCVCVCGWFFGGFSFGFFIFMFSYVLVVIGKIKKKKNCLTVRLNIF